jgi:FkbM family methyltransferase
MDIQQQRLTFLRNKGFNPKFILDIGACVGEWATLAKSIFNQADLLLVEANKDNERHLMSTGFHYKIALLGDNERDVEFFKIKNGYNTGNSIYKEQTRHYTGDNFETVKLPMTTLDKLLSSHWHQKPEMIKMDVQGAELLILDGAKQTLENCEVILLETQILEYNQNAPKVKDVTEYLDKIGFEMNDVCGLHYLPDGTLMQLDVIYIRKDSKLIKRGQLD